MNSTLQDIMGLISKRKIKVPTDKDYIVSAAFTDTHETLKPQPKMEASLINLAALKKYIGVGNQGPAGPPGPSGPAGTNGIYAQIGLGSLIVPSDGETSLIGPGVGTLTVPANAFQVGDSFTVKMCGYLTCANNEEIHIRVMSDGNVIADAGVFRLNITTNKYFELILDFTVTKIGGLGVAELFVNGQFSYNKNANTTIDANNFASIDSTQFDTTVPNALSITAEWITLNTDNKIQSQNFVLTKVY